MSTLYSIGYGNRTLDDFFDTLYKYGIKFIVDIRSKPQSKYMEAFNRPNLIFQCSQKGIKYEFMGKALGGRPDDPGVYENGFVVYDKIAKRPYFIGGLERLITANTKGVKVAIMCSELNPEDCHRSKLIGRELLKQGVEINHIGKGGNILSQEHVMLKVTKGKGEEDLFGNSNLTSRKQYSSDGSKLEED